ncbi:hypothetical protein BSIN_4511 [Burkholderia singularis]|uniref:Uncharacterized protein n=1 Tax=Burkholderia singularis TaxID=1503053 RepID=A0A238H8M0_9BURK|nr:hypothetical protein BSIN_4511 [Burkholderia singularis]
MFSPYRSGGAIAPRIGVHVHPKMHARHPAGTAFRTTKPGKPRAGAFL